MKGESKLENWTDGASHVSRTLSRAHKLKLQTQQNGYTSKWLESFPPMK